MKIEPYKIVICYLGEKKGGKKLNVFAFFSMLFKLKRIQKKYINMVKFYRKIIIFNLLFATKTNII
jgi:hypothetical protein